MSAVIEAAEAEGRGALTVRELARVLDIAEATAYQMARNGRIPVIRVSPRRYVIPIPALRAWLANTGDTAEVR